MKNLTYFLTLRNSQRPKPIVFTVFFSNNEKNVKINVNSHARDFDRLILERK